MFFSTFFEKYWKWKKRGLRLQPQAFFLPFSKLVDFGASGDPAPRIDASGARRTIGSPKNTPTRKVSEIEKKKGLRLEAQAFFSPFPIFPKNFEKTNLEYHPPRTLPTHPPPPDEGGSVGGSVGDGTQDLCFSTFFEHIGNEKQKKAGACSRRPPFFHFRYVFSFLELSRGPARPGVPLV